MPDDQRTVIARIVDPEAFSWKPLPREPNEGPASKEAYDIQDRSDAAAMGLRQGAALAKAAHIASLPQARAVGDEEVERAALLRQIAYDHFADPRLEREYAILNAAADSADGPKGHSADGDAVPGAVGDRRDRPNPSPQPIAKEAET